MRIFLLIQVTGQNNKVGSCPHGMPAGACPICKGGGGGIQRQEKKYEMSYEECFAIWQQMKADKARLEAQLNQIQNPVIPAPIKESVTKFMETVIQTITPIAKPILNFIQKAITQPVANIVKNTIIPVVKALIQHIAKPILNFVKEFMAEITDKLAAVYGELKNKLQKTLEKLTKKIPKKLRGLFEIFEIINESEESEETLKIKKKLLKEENYDKQHLQ